MNYPDSYYVVDAAAAIRQTCVMDTAGLSLEYDVIVVGGGYAGLTTALELARAGKSVVVFEAHKIGWGASGRNGGFVGAGFSQSLPKLVDTLGRDPAATLFHLSQAGAEYVRQQAEIMGGDIILGNGGLSALRHHDPDSIKQAMTLKDAYGEETRHVRRDELRQLLKTNCYFEAIESPRTFHIQPLSYALGLARLVREAGGIIVEDCPMSALVKYKSQWRVRAGSEVYDGQHLVLAGGSYMANLYPRLNHAILPVATYVIATEPMAATLDTAIQYHGCISDTRRAGDYYRRLPDGSLLWGGRITTRRSEPRQLAHMLKKDIRKIYPQLGDFKVAYAWSGLMAYATHKMPIIGQLEKGLWCATAFGGHGLNTTAMAGQLIASAIAANDDRWQQFTPFGTSWAGGIFGRMGTQAVYWFMQACDRRDEKRSKSRTNA